MKYMGNKQKIADEILTVIFNDSKKTDTFVDLFCGSCSIIERVPDSYIKIANDKNKFLIEMFKSLVKGNDYPKIITKNFSRKPTALVVGGIEKNPNQRQYL